MAPKPATPAPPLVPEPHDLVVVAKPVMNVFNGAMPTGNGVLQRLLGPAVVLVGAVALYVAGHYAPTELRGPIESFVTAVGVIVLHEFGKQ